MISNVLRGLRFRPNHPLNSADDWYTGILKNMTIHYEFVDSLFFSFNFPCNLTSCLLGDFDKILIKDFLKSNIKFIYRQLQPPSLPKEKFWECIYL